MRVSMLHWAFPPVVGGVESHLAMLGPSLVRRGNSVSMLVGSAGEGEEEDVYQGVHVERTPLMNLNFLPGDISVLEPDIRQCIKTFIEMTAPHLIHAHNLHYFSPVHAHIVVEIAKEKGIPVVLTAHNVWDDSLWEECSQLARQWDAIIAVSHYIAGELVKWGYPRERVHVVHHGINQERFLKKQSDIEIPALEGRRVIFHPARLCYDKGSHVALKALELMAGEYPDVMLVMAGTGEMVDRLHLREEYLVQIHEQVKSSGMEENVYMRHFCWEEMPSIYHRAEFCIYPSCFQEPFGMALLEAQACGKPLVVSRAGGMPEIIREGVNGFLVPVHDHFLLARCCLELLAHPERAREMGERGRQLVQEKFNGEEMVKNTEQVYQAVLEGR